MFLIILYIINTLFVMGLLSVIYFIITNPRVITILLTNFILFYNEKIGQIVVFNVILIYLALVIIAILERLFKKPKSIKITSDNGNVEITATTLETLSKNYLEEKEIIKFSKVKVNTSFNKANILTYLECYTTTNLNEKLANTKNELSEYIFKMTGVKVNKINFKVTKINSEKIVETKNITNPEIIGDDIASTSIVL